MQVSVEKTSELSRKMTVTVPEEVIQEKMANRFKSLAREVKLDGFRPGKAPQHVIKKMYGDRVRGEVTGDLIQNTYFEALQEQELVPAGQPFIDSIDDTDGFKYTAEFEVYPEVSLDGIDGLEVARPVATVEQADIDQMIEKLRSHKKTWSIVERASEQGDRITVNFSGTCEGENFTDGTVEKYPVEIGAKQMIPGFEDELIGLEAESKKTFEITFPEEYGNAKLAGKSAEFEIEVISVEETVLPEINEEFIKNYGIESGSNEEFLADVKSNMESELEQGLQRELKTAVMDALYEKIQFTLPKTLIDQEVESMMKPYAESAKKQNMKLEDLELPKDVFEAQAKRRVALGLILGEIIRKNEIKADADKVRASIEKMAKSYEKPEEVIAWYYGDQSRLQDVEQMVLEDQTVEWVVSKATVSDKPVTFDEVMNKQQQQQ